MGLFSRKDSAPLRKPAGKPRPSVTSEAQAAELRIKARRRLAGAVALILAAVVVLPMLLDSEPAPVASNIPIRIPDRQTPFQPHLSGPDAAASNAESQVSAGQSANNASTGQSGASGSTDAAAAPGQIKPDTATKPVAQQNSEAAKVPPAKPASPPAAPPPSAQQRKDDAARALALLEGRTPVASAPSPKPPVKGNFVVQAMSLDSAAEAQKQRNVLISAGLNNAFVDGPVDVNGRPKYRVRVGPFQSREAAQAAQTRLRTQGYGGAFITTQ
ncbi:SPOR domain-containing protein [Zwartia vadi]|uniref:SPOR domain-containing protein n=1 Tax=Zwartia vadi TaxID=3058168 RepID=UPI0025B50583|nr:SPOR domain-containing protein [Zwartia vadi]MDN3986466.1 SPOR domain-containing protein [Zwartia vadi]